MTEDAIERNHQERAKIAARTMRHPTERMKKDCQSKYQHAATKEGVNKTKSWVHQERSRKMKRSVSKSEETEQAKRQTTERSSRS